MDPLKFTTIAHGGMSVCNPLGDEVLDDALAILAQWLPPGRARLLDIGCGKAELLLRLVERHDVAATGVDINAAFLAEAAAKARSRGCALELHESRFADFLAGRAPGSPPFDALLCLGASQAVGPARATPTRLAPLLAPGGLLLLGEGFWAREPDDRYLAALGAARDDLTDHAGNQELGAEAGLTCVHAVATSDEDFARYEERYAATVQAHLAAHPEDPDGPEMAARLAGWREAYEAWGRETLGFGLYLYVAP
ncbi:MAG TPA: methyltransferase [Planctomycetota bacterium]|nr:methyltransferase [Planctomycetota bacterium]